MASTFDPRPRGDREHRKFGLHDTATDAAPIILHIGMQGKDVDGTTPGVVSAEDDSSIAKGDKEGRLFVSDTHPRLFSFAESYLSDQTKQEIKAAPGSGVSIYISDIVMSAGDIGATMFFLDGNAGVGDASTITSSFYLSAHSIQNISLRTPLKLTANSSLSITSIDAAEHGVMINGWIAS